MFSIFSMLFVCVISTADLSDLNSKETREIRTIICENSTSGLGCHGNTTLRITSATFGRSSSSMCVDDDDNNFCTTADALTIVKKICDGKHECFITASKTIFGESCKNVNSYVDVAYKCLHFNDTEDKNSFIFTNNKDVTQFGHSNTLAVAVGVLSTLFGVLIVVLSVVGLKIYRSYRRNDEDDDLDFSLYSGDRSTIQYDRISAGFTPIFTGQRNNTLFD